ncbi:MAG: hypothetical protein K2Y71_25420 [Xanthobacteraceae bacterium]|nr:hypothetical protein [Xanthobacteraceae bacterium]
MHKLLFVFGLLVGALAATTWAQVPVLPGPESSGQAAVIDPMAMMAGARSFPVEVYDAF